jgi:hypothetical protein
LDWQRHFRLKVPSAVMLPRRLQWWRQLRLQQCLLADWVLRQ